ncbi:hypothetical protein [Paenibacillus flagellatus]|uniref:Uncharacterized protein n=1 Tax=Paenibacillus flagellatus TaxID=2211139 RepID=A0A2V5JZI0_9BACL|nr:hypothetical protein [Paenibacillus flagellatus]PYI50734.1 hypothetical protein DLM86_28645 [Paenibacillus flagellatus]
MIKGWNERAQARAGKLALTAMLAVGAIAGIGGSAYAEDTKEQATLAASAVTVAAATVEGGAMTIAVFGPDSGLMMTPAHQRHYWKLLVDAYAPDLAAAWGQALEERKQVEATIPKAEPISVHVSDIKELQPADEMKKPIVEHKLQPLPEAGTREKGVGEIRFEKSNAVEAVPAIMDKEPPAPIARQIKLSEAVEAGDAQAIRDLLPQLLDDYRKQTAELKERLAKLPSSDSTESATKNEDDA